MDAKPEMVGSPGFRHVHFFLSRFVSHARAVNIYCFILCGLRARTGSKYDAVLDAFMKGATELVEVSMEGKEANYLRLQLSKRIGAREIGGVTASVVNGVVYLEKE